MTKKVITAAAFLAASTMLANAASVLYTFNLTDVPSNVTANINCNDGRTTMEQEMTTLKSGAKWSFSSSAGGTWNSSTVYNPFSNNISTLASNIEAQAMFSTVGINADDISKLTDGFHTGNASGTSTFTVSGLDTNTTYVVTMLVGSVANNTKFNIKWSGGEFEGGSYAYENSAKTLITTAETSLASENLSVVELKLKTGSENGNFTITLENGGSANSGGKTAVGLFAVSTIPEPSAFGLLAGLGAIALAVSRRRRRSRR